jgi:hypothetical protein
LSSWARRSGATAFVTDHRAPDVISQAALQAALCFPGGLAFCDFGLEVGVVPGAGHADLRDGHGVECRVELAVAAPGQAVVCAAGAGYLDGGGADVLGEGAGCWEAGGVSGPAQEAGGGYGCDARSVGQSASGLCDQCRHGFGVVFQLHVPCADLGDQVGGEGVAGGFGGADGDDCLQQLLGFGRGQIARRPSGQEGSQQRVELVDRADSGLGEVAASF